MANNNEHGAYKGRVDLLVKKYYHVELDEMK